MPNELPIPPELNHLIEKREGDQRRDTSNSDNDAAEAAEEQLAAGSDQDGRTQADRRKQNRRHSDR